MALCSAVIPGDATVLAQVAFYFFNLVLILFILVLPEKKERSLLLSSFPLNMSPNIGEASAGSCPVLLCVVFNPLNRLLAGALAYFLSSGSRYLTSAPPALPHKF